MEYIILGIMVIIALLAGDRSHKSAMRKRDRMIHDMYDEKYRNKK